MAYGRDDGSSSQRQGALPSSFLSPATRGRPAEFPADVLNVAGADIVGRAASIVAREAAALPTALSGAPGSFAPLSGLASPTGAGVPAVPGLPATQGPVDLERLRRQAHDFIETLLTSFSPKAPTQGGERVPLLRCAAATTPGGDGTVTLFVTNEDATPLEVTLYSSNFVSDSGGDIPSARVTVSPRSVAIAPRSEVPFEVKISVPQQTPPGTYSGLVQAMGAQYVKAVVCLEVK